VQEQVFPELRSICFLGKRWWNPEVPYDKCRALHQAIDSVTKAPVGAFDADIAQAALRDWLQHAPQAKVRQQDGSALVRFLSEERLTITDVVSFEEIAHRLSLLFPGAEIVYTRRDPIAGIRSAYNWCYARAWTEKSFSDWLESGFNDHESSQPESFLLRCYDWPRIKRAFSAYFPIVRSVEFDSMRNDPVSFMIDLIGIDSDEFAQYSWLSERPLNASVKGAIIEAHRFTKKTIRLWNRLPFNKIDEKPEYLGDSAFWRRIERILSIIPVSQRHFAVSETDIARLRARYAFHYGRNDTSSSGTSVDSNYRTDTIN